LSHRQVIWRPDDSRRGAFIATPRERLDEVAEDTTRCETGGLNDGRTTPPSPGLPGMDICLDRSAQARPLNPSFQAWNGFGSQKNEHRRRNLHILLNCNCIFGRGQI
jgi:hypothetical protein